MPTASLPALEQRLEACLLELEKTHRTRPRLPTALASAEAGQRIDDLLDEIAELQRRIDTSPAGDAGGRRGEAQAARCLCREGTAGAAAGGGLRGRGEGGKLGPTVA